MRVFLFCLLALVAACGARMAPRPAAESGSGATATANPTAAGGDAPQEAVLRGELAERDREITQLRTEVQEARARENDMRTSLEQASRALGVSAPARRTGADGGAAVAPGNGPAPRPDAILAALSAALSQEQERRELLENELARLKEETSASYAGPRVPESDYLSVKQELVVLRQTLADEQSAYEHLRAATRPSAPDGSVEAATHANDDAAADLRIRLRRLQEERDDIVESLNTNLSESQKRVADLEQQLGTARAAAAQQPDVVTLSADNTALRGQLDEEHRRTAALNAKLKVAERVNDLIFKIQAQQAEGKR